MHVVIKLVPADVGQEPIAEMDVSFFHFDCLTKHQLARLCEYNEEGEKVRGLSSDKVAVDLKLEGEWERIVEKVYSVEQPDLLKEARVGYSSNFVDEVRASGRRAKRRRNIVKRNHKKAISSYRLLLRKLKLDDSEWCYGSKYMKGTDTGM